MQAEELSTNRTTNEGEREGEKTVILIANDINAKIDR